MANFVVTPNTLLINTDQKSPDFGKPTRDFFLLLQSLTIAINDATSVYVLVDGVQTLTNKTMDGDANTFVDIGTGSLKTKTGSGGRVVTAIAAGTANWLVQWTAAGNIADALILGSGVSAFLTTPSSANLATAVTGETGTGALVFGTLPAIDRPTLASYTVAALPSVTPTGQLIYVSNETGGATVAFSDGTNFRRVQDRVIVS